MGADCPFVAKKTTLAKMAANKQCDGTECPGGCCPYVGWYCCPDGMYCAATAADCPYVSKKAIVTKMAANKQCDGTECPGGCCPYVGWYCPLMACTVLPQLLTAHLLPRRPWSLRWLPTSNVMELNAQEAAAHMLDGTAALMACTALPQLLTAHLLPRRPLSPRWLPTSNVMELNAQEAA